MDRHSRGITPTEAGDELYRRARQILDLVTETEVALARFGTAQPQSLTLGLPPAIARLIGIELTMGPRVPERIDITIEEGWSNELFDHMVAGGIDFVLGYDLPHQAGVTRLELADERFAFAAAAGQLHEDGPISLREALAHDLVFYGRQSVGSRAVRAAAERFDCGVNIVGEVGSLEVWREMVLRGVGATIVPVGALGSEIAAGRIVLREIVGGPVELRMALAARTEVYRAGVATGFVPFIQDLVNRSYLPFHGRFTNLFHLGTPGDGPARVN